MAGKIELEPGQYILFPNRNKKADNHPDWTGYHRELGGEQYEVAEWDRDSKAGRPYRFGKVSVPRNNNNEAPAQQGDSEGIPF